MKHQHLGFQYLQILEPFHRLKKQETEFNNLTNQSDIRKIKQEVVISSILHRQRG